MKAPRNVYRRIVSEFKQHKKNERYPWPLRIMTWDYQPEINKQLEYANKLKAAGIISGAFFGRDSHGILNVVAYFTTERTARKHLKKRTVLSSI